jgi:hypothetical protein
LVSTAADYLRFCQMLLNGGELDGIRILSAATVRRMTTNSLPSDIRFASNSDYVGPLGGSTWGFGFAIRTDPAWSAIPGSVGSFSWSGAWGTYFWVDPAEQLIAVNLIQVAPGKAGPFYSTFRNLTYGAFGVPDQGVPASAAASAGIDADTLAAYAGTYSFASRSSRDKQERREFGGLGINLAVDGQVKVVSTIPRMPADKAGIIANDIITHLDRQSLQGLTLNQVVERMRGPVDTRVLLKIVRRGQENPIEIPIARGMIRVAGTGAELQVTVRERKLQIEATGNLPILDFENSAAIAVVPISSNEFVVDGGDHTRLAFLRDGTGPMRMVLNPGRWQITGQRIE